MRQVECVIPILRVEDLTRSIEFYTNVMGFQKDWGATEDHPVIASVSRDKCSIMLFEGAQGNPGTWVWIGVEDAEQLHAEIQAKGAKVVMPLTNFSWALEMRVEDPDGHILRIGSECRADRPIVH